MWARVSTFGGDRVGRECLVIVLRSAASVDFIILIARHENISKTHIYILQKREEEEEGEGGSGGGWGVG